MKVCPQCKTEKEFICFWANKKTKDGMCVYCKECAKDRQRAYSKTHREHINKKALIFYEKNRERLLKERQDNEEVVKVWKANWRANNKHKICAYANKRRAVLLQAIPENVDWDAINRIYKEAAERRRNGENVQVDHIIPLMGKTVRGLHCPENLQILPAKENMSKGNRIPTNINLSDYQKVIYT